jgi:hypothetical protein
MKGVRFFSVRRFVSLFTAISFLVLSLSGAVLYIDPPGRVAYWTGWTFLGLTKNSWSGLHTVFALLFLLSGSLHAYYNWKSLLFYIKSRVASHIRLRSEFIASVLTTFLVLSMTLADWPPFSAVIRLGEAVSASWEEEQKRPPVPHAEQLTIAEFARAIGLPAELLLLRLEAAGIRPENETETIKDLAARYGLSPAELSNRMLSVPVKSSGAEMHRGMGYGKMTVEEAASVLGVPAGKVLTILSRHGIRAKENSSLRDLAAEYGMLPYEIIVLVERSLRDGKEARSNRNRPPAGVWHQ